MFNYFKRHKVVSCLVLVNIIAIIIVVAIIVVHVSKTATIDIKVAPSEAKIEINGGAYDNFQSYDVAPGNYHVKISMDGMRTREFDFTLEKDGFQRVWSYLVDENGGFDYYLSHPEEIPILEQVATDEKAEAFLEKYNAVVEIDEELPIKVDDYTENFSDYIEYEIVADDREDCPKVRCLKIIDGTGGNEQAAKDYLKSEGYNLDDYEITYEYQSVYSVRAGDD